jgi:hypothetical protein
LSSHALVQLAKLDAIKTHFRSDFGQRVAMFGIARFSTGVENLSNCYNDTHYSFVPPKTICAFRRRQQKLHLDKLSMLRNSYIPNRGNGKIFVICSYKMALTNIGFGWEQISKIQFKL